ncbi:MULTISPECIES: hypothetical protein [unclassified Streptomyces]|uniref:hypothetical protein n=1 Tax=unclassified Streptomyces TaxID=2593676 RepID=UPI002E1D7029|nr:hypothetical protein OG217_37570 [Streptomyces sp. NBC_01023]
MGRLKANKPRRDKEPGRERFRIDDRVVSQTEILEEGARLSDHVDDHGRLLFMDSPALGLGQTAIGIDSDTGAIQTTDREDPMPVALFEPARAMMTNHPDGPPREIQVEGALIAGLRRFPRGIADLRTIPGWALHRLPDDQLELRSPDGGVYSRIAVPSAPDWYSAALHHCHVMCLYGPQLGVRTPPGTTVEQYNDTKRLEELRQARGRGLVAAGIIAYHNNR